MTEDYCTKIFISQSDQLQETVTILKIFLSNDIELQVIISSISKMAPQIFFWFHFGLVDKIYSILQAYGLVSVNFLH